MSAPIRGQRSADQYFHGLELQPQVKSNGSVLAGTGLGAAPFSCRVANMLLVARAASGVCEPTGVSRARCGGLAVRSQIGVPNSGSIRPRIVFSTELCSGPAEQSGPIEIVLFQLLFQHRYDALVERMRCTIALNARYLN